MDAKVRCWTPLLVAACFIALGVHAASGTPAGQQTCVVLSLFSPTPTGYHWATVAEATINQDQLLNLLRPWDIATLADGWMTVDRIACGPRTLLSLLFLKVFCAGPSPRERCNVPPQLTLAPPPVQMLVCPTGTTNFTFAVPGLPLPTNAYEPAIDNATMSIHSRLHVGAAVTAVNGLLNRYPSLRGIPLVKIVEEVGTDSFTFKHKLLPNDTTALRNNAGSLFNHGLFWQIMTTPGTSTLANTTGGSSFATVLTSFFTSVDAFLEELRAAGRRVFGSGWAWLIVKANGKLAVVTTPNQDNPLMTAFVAAENRGVPILGVDVWEHAYYLRYQNRRPDYLTNWTTTINWARVVKNYNQYTSAASKDLLWC